MSRLRLTAFLSFGLCGTLLMLTVAPAQPVKLDDRGDPVVKGKSDPVEKKMPIAGQNEIIQEFPCSFDGKSERPQTAWKVRWATKSGNGLYLKSAWFRKTPAEKWMQVLGDVRLAEAFVPYHRGTPRFWDVSYNFGLDVVTKDDAGPFGTLLRARAADKSPTVVKEIRDRGIMWKHPRAGVRRGQTLVLWAALSAANYRYLIEYGFQDEGTITFRVGASGHNYGGSEWTPHMHNAMWRIDVNLDGPDHNSVELCEHIEPDGEPTKARTQHTVLKEECALDWDPQKFTMLRVINTQRKNIRGEPFSYDLMTPRMGNSRHFGNNEECTQHDLWVTLNKPNEMQFRKLPDYISDRESIEDADVVLWYNVASHHEPRSEDGQSKNGRGFDGATHLMWTSFELRPRNIWDRTPFYPYPNKAPNRDPIEP